MEPFLFNSFEASFCTVPTHFVCEAIQLCSLYMILSYMLYVIRCVEFAVRDDIVIRLKVRLAVEHMHGLIAWPSL